MALSDQLQKLSDQSRELEASIKATKEKDDTRLKARKAELHSELEATRTRLGNRIVAAEDDTASDWAQAQKSVSDAFAGLREKAQARQSDWSARRAERQADDAEADALDAIDFAFYAIEEAEYAVLDAAIARDEADAKAAALDA